MIWASSQQILENWDLLRSIWNTHFHCWHFLLLACDDSTLFSVNFRKLRYYWEAFQTLVFITNTFYYESVMIWTCSQQILENWDFAEKRFDTCFHYRHFLLSACFVLWCSELVLSKFWKTEILLRSVLNTRFHCKHFLLWVCDDLNLFSANFRKLRSVLNTFFSLRTLLIISLFWFELVLSKF